MRDGLKTVSREEWETSLQAEQLSSSLYCCREEVEQPAEKIHSNFLNVKGKKKGFLRACHMHGLGPTADWNQG